MSDATCAIDAKAFKAFEREGYSRVAERYDEVAARATSQVNEPLLDAVGATRGTRLLDVACGPGRLSAAALKRGALVTALDFADSMVALARHRCPEATVQEGDAEHLPFDADRFDAVACSFGLLHFPAPEQAVAEAFRVLRPTGRYAFTCWTPPQRNPFMALVLGSVQRHGSPDTTAPAGPPLFRFGDPAECIGVLEAAGFVAVSVTEVPVVWTFASPEAVVDGIQNATARLGPLLTQQSGERRRAIADAIVEGARGFTVNRRVEIPSPVLLAAGRRP